MEPAEQPAGRDAVHQGNLSDPGSGANPGQRLVRIELAATNGMLSGLDRRSQLLDPESYRVIRGAVSRGPDATRADNGTIRPPSATASHASHVSLAVTS